MKLQITYVNTKICYFGKEKSENKYAKNENYGKVRSYCHYTGNIEELDIS